MDSTELVNVRCSAIVLRGEHLLLLRRERDEESNWVLPGGTPKAQESVGSCARREVAEEAGLFVTVGRVAFVLEANNPEYATHVLDLVFTTSETDPRTPPHGAEPGLQPQFIHLDDIGKLPLRPPIAGHIRAFHEMRGQGAAAYLGNLWRPAGNLLTGSTPVEQW